MNNMEAVEAYISGGHYSAWNRPNKMMVVPKNPALQRLLLRKIKEITGVEMTLQQLTQALEDAGFEPTRDPDAVSWARRQPKK